jgi:hypothetical protein
MRKSIAAIATSLLFASPASADDSTIARLRDLSGNVLVSRDFRIASASDDARLAPGSRVLVTTNSAVTVEYDNGCRVRLGAGERLEVRDAPACAQHLAEASADAGRNAAGRP